MRRNLSENSTSTLIIIIMPIRPRRRRSNTGSPLPRTDSVHPSTQTERRSPESCHFSSRIIIQEFREDTCSPVYPKSFFHSRFRNEFAIVVWREGEGGGWTNNPRRRNESEGKGEQLWKMSRTVAVLESHVCREIWTRVAERKGREGKGRGHGRRGGTPVQLVVRSCSNSTYIFHGGADK